MFTPALFCTCIFNPTRPFFTLSNRSHRAATALFPQQLAAVSSAPFSIPDLLGTTGSSLLLHSDIPATTSQKLEPTLLIGTVGPWVHWHCLVASHFLGRGGNSSPRICLGLCKWHFKRSPHALGVHEPMGYAKTLKHFRAGFSVHIQFRCLGAGTRADARGQKAPLPLGREHA